MTGGDAGDEETFEVLGIIRFCMPENEVDLPLWDDDGLLPWEPELLEAGLGISAKLTDDLKCWGAAWNSRRRVRDPASQEERLRTEAGALVEGMRSELKPGLEVRLELR
jgi:hypothetical protein